MKVQETRYGNRWYYHPLPDCAEQVLRCFRNFASCPTHKCVRDLQRSQSSMHSRLGSSLGQVYIGSGLPYRAAVECRSRGMRVPG